MLQPGADHVFDKIVNVCLTIAVAVSTLCDLVLGHDNAHGMATMHRWQHCDAEELGNSTALQCSHQCINEVTYRHEVPVLGQCKPELGAGATDMYIGLPSQPPIHALHNPDIVLLHVSTPLQTGPDVARHLCCTNVHVHRM